MTIDSFAAVLATNQFSGSERVLFLLGSAFFIWSAVRGVKTGKVSLKFSTFRRSNEVFLFWFGIVMNILIGIIGLTGFIFGRDIWK
jgi:hypothetical protein